MTDDEYGKVQTHATDVDGNRVQIRVNSEKRSGEEIFSELSETLDELVDKHGH
jgi:hypothetical protein